MSGAGGEREGQSERMGERGRGRGEGWKWLDERRERERENVSLASFCNFICPSSMMAPLTDPDVLQTFCNHCCQGEQGCLLIFLFLVGSLVAQADPSHTHKN